MQQDVISAHERGGRLTVILRNHLKDSLYSIWLKKKKPKGFGLIISLLPFRGQSPNHSQVWPEFKYRGSSLSFMPLYSIRNKPMEWSLWTTIQKMYAKR